MSAFPMLMVEREKFKSIRLLREKSAHADINKTSLELKIKLRKDEKRQTLITVGKCLTLKECFQKQTKPMKGASGCDAWPHPYRSLHVDRSFMKKVHFHTERKLENVRFCCLL